MGYRIGGKKDGSVGRAAAVIGLLSGIVGLVGLIFGLPIAVGAWGRQNDVDAKLREDRDAAARERQEKLPRLDFTYYELSPALYATLTRNANGQGQGSVDDWALKVPILRNEIA